MSEKKIPFSLASPLQKFFAGLLGAVNLTGVLWLGSNLAYPPLAFVREPILFMTLSKVGICI
jgi:hypothetical protein